MPLSSLQWASVGVHLGNVRGENKRCIGLLCSQRRCWDCAFLPTVRRGRTTGHSPDRDGIRCRLRRLGRTTAHRMAVHSTGEVNVVAMGPYISLVVYYFALPGENWNSVQIAGPATTVCRPAIAVRSSGETDVVAQGPNNNLMYYWALPGQSWYGTEIAGTGTTFSSPAIAVRSSGGGRCRPGTKQYIDVLLGIPRTPMAFGADCGDWDDLHPVSRRGTGDCGAFERRGGRCRRGTKQYINVLLGIIRTAMESDADYGDWDDLLLTGDCGTLERRGGHCRPGTKQSDLLLGIPRRAMELGADWDWDVRLPTGDCGTLERRGGHCRRGTISNTTPSNRSQRDACLSRRLSRQHVVRDAAQRFGHKD